MKVTQNQALELLTVHTNKITAAGLVNDIINSSPSGVEYVNIKHRLYHIAHALKQIPYCESLTCNTPVKWCKVQQKYTRFCGYTCSNNSSILNKKQKRLTTNKKRYGGNAPACSDTVRQKMKQTNVERYGDNYTKINSNKSKIIIQEKYGVDNISQLQHIKLLKQHTSLQNYGVAHPMQHPDVINKIKSTCTSRYRRVNGNQQHISDKAFQVLNNKTQMVDRHINMKQSIKQIADDLSVSVYVVYASLTKHNIDNQHNYQANTISSGHQEIIIFLKHLNIKNIVINCRTIIHPQELDIYLPDYKLAIEFNGCFWHSELFKKSCYHLNKTLECEKLGIRLIHIFEDEWNNQQQQCQDTLKHLLHQSSKGSFARNTIIKEIRWKQAKEFLDSYHLLGSGNCGNYRIGAFDKQNNIIGVMVFGNQNNENSKQQVELRRFVTNKKNNPGLGSKMFKYAVTMKKYNEVIAFVDRRWFTGLVKQFIGFRLVDCTQPAVWWTDGTSRYHRRFVQKNELIIHPDDEKLSKRQLLRARNIYRLWDCGKFKFQWNK